MFDFKKIVSLIPPQGRIAFTITTGRNDRLVVLVQPIYAALEDLAGRKKEDYQQARVPMVLEGTPEELNQDFIRLLEETESAEGNLQRAFLAKQGAIDKAISTTQKSMPSPEKRGHTDKKPETAAKTTDTTAEQEGFSLFE